MRLLSIIFITLTISTMNVYADERNTWAELSVGGGSGLIGYAVNFKSGDDDANWSVELGKYEEFQLFSYIEDRKTGSAVDVDIITLGFSKNWNKIRDWGYSEAGIGIGVAKGTWANNCTRVDRQSSFGGHDVCDISDGVKLGIPLHGTAVFGKYFGIGITAKAFLTTEHLHAGIMITLPFGDFTN